MSEFEQIPEIAERIKRSKMELQDNGNYWAPEWDSQSCCDQDFVNNFKKGWLSQQAIIDDLRSQLKDMEQCYIQKKKRAELLESDIKNLVMQLSNNYEVAEGEYKKNADSYYSGKCDAFDLAEQLAGLVLRGEHETK